MARWSTSPKQARPETSRPGASVWGAGGVSGLPSLRGLADERLKISIDGAESTSACGNHMNSPLSYITSTQVTAAQVVAGISPVSLGGDHIGGVIAVQTAPPLFAKPGAGLPLGGANLAAFKANAAATQMVRCRGRGGRLMWA